jgi:hypothetical protein
MPPADERSALRLVARGFVALVIVLAAIPAYLTLAPGWRPLAARLACATLVAAVCVRLVRSVRTSMEGPPSALETPPSRPPAPEVDERFLRLRDELRFSVRSRQYFETILWPQLQRIARTELPPPTERRGWRRDGPPLTSLERVIAAIERGA